MDRKEAEALSEVLKGLACKGCTEGWLEKHVSLSDPIEDIKSCGSMGFIPFDLQERLISEVREINSGISK